MLVALGVCGGIGAYKAVEVARGLQKRGHEVVAVMTQAATRFVGPVTFEAITRRRLGGRDRRQQVETLMLSKVSFVRLLTTRPSVGEAAVRFSPGVFATRTSSSKLSHFIRLRRASPVSSLPPCARKTLLESRAGHTCVAISQSELALLVGASRPKVNAALGMLETEGAIKRRGQQVVCDVAALSGIGRLDDKEA